MLFFELNARRRVLGRLFRVLKKKKKSLAIKLCLIFQIIYAANLKYKIPNVDLSMIHMTQNSDKVIMPDVPFL